MPSRNAIKTFAAEMSYHCYNRGVEKRAIFLDSQDYGVFLARLKQMLSDPDEIKDEFTKRERVKSFYGRIELRSYCLMPNHFHLLLYQYDDTAIMEFMRTLGTSYTMYFNKRYERVGHLFQGRYKARRIDSDAYNLHISRYIHLNPYNEYAAYETYQYSSMQFVLHPEAKPHWLRLEPVLKLHAGRDAYRRFVREYASTDKIDELDDYHALD